MGLEVVIDFGFVGFLVKVKFRLFRSYFFRVFVVILRVMLFIVIFSVRS